MKPAGWPFGRLGLLVTVTLILTSVFSISRSEVASAHPLGNFTINQYSRVMLASEEVSIRYVLDMAEIPTFREMADIDLDRDGQVSSGERATYLERKVKELTDELHLSIDSSPVEVRVTEQQLEFPPGQGGLPTMRLSILLRGPVESAEGQKPKHLYYRNDNYANRLGWREIVIQAGEGVFLIDPTAPQSDTSNELRAYPEDLLSSPPNQKEANTTFAFSDLSHPAKDEVSPKVTQPPAKSSDFLVSLVNAEKLSLPVVIVSLMVALGLGALHAVSPGHGKTIMAAYLVGTRGTAKHALFLGFTVTISHTLGVLGLGLIVLYASTMVAPEQLYPWLTLVSGVIIVAIGIWLLAARFRHREPSHAHHHDSEDLTTFHAHPHTKFATFRAAGFLSRIKEMSIGMVRGRPHAQHPARSHQRTQDGSRLRITWKSLTALGVVGGLLPSTSALVILLAAFSLHRVGFGLLLILAFSAGMASVLAGVGLLLVYAGRFIERFQAENRTVGVLTRLLPLTTALVVLVSGLIVSFRAVSQINLL